MEEFITKGNNFHQSNGHVDSSLKYFSLAEQQAKAHEFWDGYVYILFAKSVVCNTAQLYDQFEKNTILAHEAALKYLPDDHEFRAHCLNQLSVLHANNNNYAKALELVEEARILMQEWPDSRVTYTNMIKNHENIGTYKLRLGQTDEGLKYYEKSLQMGLDSARYDPFYIKAIQLVLHKIPRVYFELRDFQKSIELFKETLEIFNRDRDKHLTNILRNLNSLSIAYIETDQLTEAAKTIEKAEKLHDLVIQKQGINFNQHITYRAKAFLYSKLGKLDLAYSYADSSLAIARKLLPNQKKHSLFGNLLKFYGTYYQRAGEHRKAIEKYQLALEEFSLGFNGNSIYQQPTIENFERIESYIFELLILKIQAFQKLYESENNIKDLQGAWETSLLFSDLVDQYRTSILSEQNQLFLALQIQKGYELGIQSALNLYEKNSKEELLSQAFYLAEKSKSTSLYLSLNNSKAKYNANIPQTLLENEKKAVGELVFLKNQLFNEKLKRNPDSTKISDWENLSFSRARSLDSLKEEISKRYATYYQLNYAGNLSTEDFVKSLPPSALLLEYFAGDSALYIFALNKKGIEYKVIENSSTLHAQVDQFVKSLHEVNSEDYKVETFRSEAFELYSQIFDPKWEDHQNLIIIPDGILGLLPFEILLKHEEGSHFRELPYLLKDHNIQYAYSAQLLFNDPLKEQVKAAQKIWAGFAPQFEGLKTLPLSVQEVEQIAQLMQGETYTHQRADKATFLAEAKDYKILHLATHGYPNVENPQFARLEFTAQDGINDGILYAHELMNERLAAELAVLSACETGYGSIAKGEGIMSLARSFRYAGVPSIVMSLWKAESGVSKKIMASFYTYLQDGKGKDEALRLAKLDYLKAPLPGRSHPRAWSHFVLIGDAEPLKKSQPWIWIFSLLVPAMVVILLAFRRKKLITKAPI